MIFVKIVPELPRFRFGERAKHNSIRALAIDAGKIQEAGVVAAIRKPCERGEFTSIERSEAIRTCGCAAWLCWRARDITLRARTRAV